jgi:RNA polymerase sigma-70 factor (ECF subfamily)
VTSRPDVPRLVKQATWPGDREVRATDQDGQAQDAVLVERLASGDESALELLYERYGVACYRLARQVTASATLAEDAVQEAFVGLWRSSESFLGSRGTVRAWLLAMTHHKAVDVVRREAAERRRLDAQAARLAVESHAEADLAVEVCDDSVAGDVREALAELPVAQRDMLTLAYFGGYSQSQIAALTGIPIGTVKTRMHAAMRRLRLRLAPLEGAREGTT